MSTGKLNYAYRLTSARFVILRMRLQRYIQRHVFPRHGIAPRNSFSRTTVFLSLGFCLAAFIVAGVVAKRWTTASTSNALAMDTTANSVETVDRAESHGQFEQIAVLSSKIDLLTDKAFKLESALTVQSAENTSLTEQIKQKDAELDAMRGSARNRSVQFEELEKQNMLLREMENQKFALEQQLLEKERLLAEAKTQAGKVNTEHKVVYNITNIPVGTHVSEEQIRNDIQSATEQSDTQSSFAGELEGEILTSDDQQESPYVTQSFTYPFGANPSDVNDVDPYEQYRDSSGDSDGWKGDSYLADMLGQEEDKGGLEEIESFLHGEPETAILYSDPAVRVPVRDPASGNVILREEPYFGPASDRYEDLVEPGMAELPGDPQPPGKN